MDKAYRVISPECPFNGEIGQHVSTEFAYNAWLMDETYHVTLQFPDGNMLRFIIDELERVA